MPVRKAAPVRPDHLGPRTASAAMPAIETITRFLSERPAWLLNEYFEVPADLFVAGRTEMKDHMKRRGFPLPVSADCPFENFMLFGKVIVQGE